MSLNKINNPNVKEGLRITNKPGVNVQTWREQLGMLFKWTNSSFDAVTAGSYSSSNSPGTVWYKITSNALGDLYIQDIDIGKTVVYVYDSRGAQDVLGRWWKPEYDVWAGGVNVRNAPNQNQTSIVKPVFTGWLGKFEALQKNGTENIEYVKTNTGLYLASNYAFGDEAEAKAKAGQSTPNPNQGNQNQNQQNDQTGGQKIVQTVKDNKLWIGAGLLLVGGGVLWWATRNN